MNLNLSKLRRLTAFGLFAFLIVGTAQPWLLDLISAQRAFGFILSADLIAFAMLVYIYERETDTDVNWHLLLIGCSIIAMLIFFSIVTP